jgi:hypothetical protein
LPKCGLEPVEYAFSQLITGAAVYSIAGQVFICPQLFFFQFATLLLSAACLGRQALWLVLVVGWFFVRPANVLDYEAWALDVLYYI